MSRRTRQQNRDRDARAARRSNIVYDNGELGNNTLKDVK